MKLEEIKIVLDWAESKTDNANVSGDHVRYSKCVNIYNKVRNVFDAACEQWVKDNCVESLSSEIETLTYPESDYPFFHEWLNSEGWVEDEDHDYLNVFNPQGCFTIEELYRMFHNRRTL